MGKFCVSVDSVADISEELYNFLSVSVIPFKVRLGISVTNDRITSKDELSSLYKAASDPYSFDIVPPSREEYEEFFDELAENNQDIIHICQGASFSSAHLNALFAAKNTMTKYYGSTVYVIDSHATSSGLALFAEYAINLRNKSYSADDAYVKLVELQQKIEQHVITKNIARFNHFHTSGMGSIAEKSGSPVVISVDDIGKPVVSKRHSSTTTAVGSIASRYELEKNVSPVYVFGSSDVNLLLKTVAQMRKKNASDIKMSSMGLCNSLLFGEGSVYVSFIGKPPKSRQKPRFNPGKASDFFDPEA